MPFVIYVDETASWLAINYNRIVDADDLVASREQAASLNHDGRLHDFLLDFTGVSEFMLSPEVVERIMHIDKARVTTLPSGRCAIVASREIVEIGTTYLAAVSLLPLDYRTFTDRQPAEAWLRGALPDAPPRLPRRML